MMTTPTRFLREIKNVNDFKYIKKLDRYIVDLTCKDREPEEYWLTEKQLSKICECLNTEIDELETPVRAPSGRTIYAAFEAGETRERFIWCSDNDNKWLTEKFGPFSEDSEQAESEEEIEHAEEINED